MSSYIDRNNTYVVPLENGETFTGTLSNVDKYQGVLTTVKTDQDGVLTLEWSNDGANWDFSHTEDVTAGVALSVHKQHLGTYYRVSMENDSGSDQTYLRLHSRFVNDINDLDGVTLTANNSITAVPTVEATLWDNEVILAEDTTASSNIQYCSKVHIVGSVSSACVIYIETSHDGTTWAESGTTVNISASGDYSVDVTSHAKYIRFRCDTGCTITLHLFAKN